MLEAGHKLDQHKWGLYLHTAELSRRPQDPRMYESHDPRIPGYLNPRIRDPRMLESISSLPNLLLLIPSSWNPVFT